MNFRKQNRSCDECRRSRIGCDAHAQPGQPCSNCKRRAKTCTTNVGPLLCTSELADRASGSRSAGKPGSKAAFAEDQVPRSSTNIARMITIHSALQLPGRSSVESKPSAYIILFGKFLQLCSSRN